VRSACAVSTGAFSRTDLDIAGQAVTAVAHGGDDTGAQYVRFDLAAQAADLIVDRPVKRSGHAPRCHFQQLIAAHDDTRAFEQDGQEFQLTGGYLIAGAVRGGQGPSVIVQFEMGEPDALAREWVLRVLSH